MVDRSPVDHQAVDDGNRVLFLELAKQAFPGQRIPHCRPVLLKNHCADISLGIGKEILAGGVQLQLLIALVRAIAFIIALHVE